MMSAKNSDFFKYCYWGDDQDCVEYKSKLVGYKSNTIFWK